MTETKRRRPKGTGSIAQRANGTWVGQIQLGYAEGRRHRRSVYGKTRQEVESALARILARPVDERPATVLRHSGEKGPGWHARIVTADQAATHTIEQWLAKRDAIGCCVYCGVDGPLTEDHVVPISRGGDNSLGNVVPACFRCNAAKGADTAYEFIRRQLLT